MVYHKYNNSLLTQKTHKETLKFQLYQLHCLCNFPRKEDVAHKSLNVRTLHPLSISNEGNNNEYDAFQLMLLCTQFNRSITPYYTEQKG